MSSPNTPEPNPEHNDLPAVWDLVVEDIKERDRIGTKKYGTRLQPFNGRNALHDAYQEALDLVVYLRQLIFEQECDHEYEVDPGITDVQGNRMVRCKKCSHVAIGIFRGNELCGAMTHIPTFEQDEEDEALYHIVREYFQIETWKGVKLSVEFPGEEDV